jgi:hypothetical protein
MVRAVWKALRSLLVGLIVLEALYLFGVNLFLNTRFATRSINRRPQRFEIRWRSAWSSWPGMVWLRGVETRGQSRAIDWYAHLDSVTATFQLTPLAGRTVHLRDVRATGVDYRQRRIRPPDLLPKFPVADLPPIPGVFDARRAASGSHGPPGPRGQPWTIVADRIRCDLDQLWLDRFRLKGAMRLETPMGLVVRGPMQFSRVRLTMAKGDLLAGQEKIFADLTLDVDARLHPFVPRQSKRLGFFRSLSGRFDLRSPSASLFFLDAYFRKTPWVHFNNRAAGRITFVLDHGRLQPGSSMEIVNDHADMQIIDRRILGHGVISARVEEVDGAPQSTLTLTMDEFRIVPLDSDVAFARGTRATLVAISRAPDFVNPFTDVRVVFDQPDGQILDLTFYNRMIPAGSNFRLVSGTGTLHYHIEGSSQARSLHGTIDLTIRDGVARFKDVPIRGSLALHTLLVQATPRDRFFDISGTRLDLRVKDPPWSAVVTLPRARMSFAEPIATDAHIGLAMQDTRPIVALYDALKGIPGWIQHMMTIENIRGGAALHVHGGQVFVNDLDITGEKLHALGDLAMGESGHDGILYIRFHGFSIGVRLQPNGHDLKILRPRHWFETERAARRRAQKE